MAQLLIQPRFASSFIVFVLTQWLSCGGNWVKRGKLELNWEVERTRALRRDFALFGGNISIPPFDDRGRFVSVTDELKSRRAHVWRWTKGMIEPVPIGRGSVQVIEGDSSSLFASIATIKPSGNDSDYRLVRSVDEGRSWKELGPIPLETVDAILFMGGDEVWVTGFRGPILRSVDGGLSWRTIDVPDRVSDGSAKLARTSSGVILYGTSSGLLLTRDLGLSWSRLLPEKSNVWAVDGDRLIAVDGGRSKLGTVVEGRVEFERDLRLPTDEFFRIFRALVRGQLIRFLATDVGRDGLVYCESRDGGANFTRQVVHARSGRINADLSEDGGGIAIGLLLDIVVPPE
jgi:hypothetical protein